MPLPRSLLPLLVLALAAPQDDAERRIGRAGEPVTIAGLRGVTTVSTVFFEQAPERPHRFETHYVFPERARWEMSLEDGQVQREYRFGSAVYLQAQRSGRTVPYAGDALLAALRRIELRCAALLFPDGFEWTGTGGDLAAALSPAAGIAPTDEPRPVGSLRARLDDAGRLADMAVLAPDGTVQESLEVAGWRRHGERDWPSGFRLRVDGNPVWTETIERVDLTRRYLDAFFVPVDQRTAGGEGEGGRIQELELPELTVRAFPLSPGTDWDAARERALELVAVESARAEDAGLELDPVPRFEVDSRGRPTSVVLNLVEVGETVPEGWARLEARMGLVLVLEHVRLVNGNRIQELLDAVPDGARPELGYVRHLGTPQGDLVQLVIALVPE